MRSPIRALGRLILTVVLACPALLNAATGSAESLVLEVDLRASAHSWESSVFAVDLRDAPTVTGVTPARGRTAGGTSVTITGTSFIGATGVTIGGRAATSVVVVNATTITAVTPPGTVGATNVVVTTAIGSGTGTAVFVYSGPPVITTQPASVTLPSGQSATLGVVASGIDSLSYQWYWGDSGDLSLPIAGAIYAGYTTPALTGWARYWVQVTNPYGTADSATTLVKVTGGTMTIADWTAQVEGTPQVMLTDAQRAPLATPAGDGVTNLLKFALGVPPLESAAAYLPKLQFIDQGGGTRAIALVFTVNPQAQGIGYALEVSENLVTWTEVQSAMEPQGNNPDGTVLMRLRELAPTAARRRFGRLKVELTPAMAEIAAATFTMGDSLDSDGAAMPLHSVTLPAFYIAKTLTTWQEW